MDGSLHGMYGYSVTVNVSHMPSESYHISTSSRPKRDSVSKRIMDSSGGTTPKVELWPLHAYAHAQKYTRRQTHIHVSTCTHTRKDISESENDSRYYL